jgi:glycosyltransferase involved in cell wall biosynthesis
VLPYLRQIAGDGIEVSLLTFEPDLVRAWSAQEKADWNERLERDGIHWFSLAYHKRPSLPAKIYDILVGTLFVARLSRREKIDVLHARGHVAAAIGALAKKFNGTRLIFDIRGFMPEEYVDAGLWVKGGRPFRWTKAAEKRMMSASDAFVVLTERAREILFSHNSDTDSAGRPVEVIPCCVDSDRFRVADVISRDRARKELAVLERKVLVYVGALGGWYLTEEMAEFMALARARDPSIFCMILTQSPSEMIEAHLRDLGMGQRDYLIHQVPPQEIPRYLKAADVAVSFIKPCYSKLSSSPTKIAEYLAGGLPVICNAGIGDLDQMIESDRVGVLIREFTREAYLSALAAVEDMMEKGDVAERCRASARERFDLVKVGGFRYRRLYRRLLNLKDRSGSPADYADLRRGAEPKSKPL